MFGAHVLFLAIDSRFVGVQMQFGRLHGLALAVLGVLLVGFQIMLFMTPKKVVNGGTDSSVPKVERKSIPSAGILGALSLFAGVVIMATRRRADEPEPKNAIK
jgi:hypothetical protein